MKITYNNTTIDFFDFDFHVNEVILTLSGGLDSASLFYLICKHLPHASVIPFTARDANFTIDSQCANEVTKFMQKEFVDIDIKDLVVYDINETDLDKVSLAEIEDYKEQRQDLYHMPNRGVSKTIQLNQAIKDIKSKYPNAVRCDAMTSNPPDYVMENFNGWDDFETRRDPKQVKNTRPNKRLYKPFVNLDKKFIADIFFQNNLMQTLFPLTKSCCGGSEITENYTKPCKKCFHCFEKYWAFECY